MTPELAGCPLKYCKTCGCFLRGTWRTMHADWGHDVRDTTTTLDGVKECDWCNQYMLRGTLESIDMQGTDDMGHTVFAPKYSYYRCTQCRIKHHDIRERVERQRLQEASGQ